MNKFYLTTAIPYVNAKPHIGHALEIVQADVIKRLHKLLNEDVCLLSGADENALKNVQAAEAEGVPVQKLVDKNAKLFEQLAKKLNVQFDVFQRGSSREHHKASQKLWGLCKSDIYKKKYTGLYCVGCEQFYTQEELDKNGECFEHPGKKLEEVSEENYFFRLSKYQDKLIQIIESGELKIVPSFREKEVLQFIKQGLKDLSVSRSNERAKNWGVQVSGDPTQRIYVWFDALNIYQSGIGFGSNEKNYKKWWPADVHVIGKGILRFHAIYWPAFLLSAGLKLPKTIFVHDYLTVDGQKMSKTLGNVVDPIELVNKYGADALRYYLLAKVSPFQDGDFSEKKLVEAYNSDLANGLGNLVSRVSKLCERISIANSEPNKFSENLTALLNEFNFDMAITDIWARISHLDQEINKREPWKINNIDELTQLLNDLVKGIREIAFDLKPFLPETAEKILEQFERPEIKSGKPLFPRL